MNMVLHAQKIIIFFYRFGTSDDEGNVYVTNRNTNIVEVISDNRENSNWTFETCFANIEVFFLHNSLIDDHFVFACSVSAYKYTTEVPCIYISVICILYAYIDHFDIRRFFILILTCIWSTIYLIFFLQICDIKWWGECVCDWFEYQHCSSNIRWQKTSQRNYYWIRQ